MAVKKLTQQDSLQKLANAMNRTVSEISEMLTLVDASLSDENLVTYYKKLNRINVNTGSINFRIVEEDGKTIFHHLQDGYMVQHYNYKIVKKAVAAFEVLFTTDGVSVQKCMTPSEKFRHCGFNEEEHLAEVMRDGHRIRHISNPSEAVQLAAVRENGHALKSISDPTEAVKVAAVTQNHRAFEHISNPSEEVQKAAVAQHGWFLTQIENPSEAVQLAAVNANPASIKWIRKSTLATQLAAVNADPSVASLIRFMFKEVKFIAKIKGAK